MTVESFLLGFTEYLAVHGGYEVTVLSDGIATREMTETAPHVSFQSVAMRREPSPLYDLLSLCTLIRKFAIIRPEVVVYATPKASLLAAIAAVICRVPSRLYQLWGLRLETCHGLQLKALSAMERIASRCSTGMVANSRSLADAYVGRGLNGRLPVDVLGEGSSHGVDVKRFDRDTDYQDVDADTEAFLSAGGFVVGYVGRLHPDKGIETLINAVSISRARGLDARVLLVGGEEGFYVSSNYKERELTPYIYACGARQDPRPYYARMNVLVLVSRREGFPNVVLEAAGMRVPAIVSDATGVVDSVVDGITGRVVRTGDAEALAVAIEEMATNSRECEEMGLQARARAVDEFSQEQVWARYTEWLTQHQERRSL